MAVDRPRRTDAVGTEQGEEPGKGRGQALRRERRRAEERALPGPGAIGGRDEPEGGDGGARRASFEVEPG